MTRMNRTNDLTVAFCWLAMIAIAVLLIAMVATWS